ncbi:MAG TPA: sigma-70 family RNA polymerase sigma factor [Thermodesulfobacteriota bacterium]|nr:sigma-70 family RNA polymerase sigma factor [Thermodesulfobacteriota bacterium]
MFGLVAKKELTDEEAMARFQKGDPWAFDLLLERYNRGVLRFIMKMIGSRGTLQRAPTQAEDLLQEVFLKVIENKKKYDSSQKFTTWLYTLTRNRCIDYLRSENHRHHDSLDASLSRDEVNGAVVLDIIKSGERNQEEAIIDKEIQRLLDSGIEELREEFREVFLLREIEGLSLKEIADITDTNLSTVKSRLRYAYQNLREVFIRAGYFGERQRVKEV